MTIKLKETRHGVRQPSNPKWGKWVDHCVPFAEIFEGYYAVLHMGALKPMSEASINFNYPYTDEDQAHAAIDAEKEVA